MEKIGLNDISREDMAKIVKPIYDEVFRNGATIEDRPQYLTGDK